MKTNLSIEFYDVCSRRCQCGQPSTIALIEECCTGQFIDCACGGQGIGEDYCHACFEKMVAGLIDEVTELQRRVNMALRGELFQAWCNHCQRASIIQRFYCGDDGDDVSCTECNKSWESSSCVLDGVEEPDIPF